MGLQRKFQEFSDKIHITRQSDDYKNARIKDESITEEIKNQFKQNGYRVIDSFIQGSLATYTAIRQNNKDFDIDRAMIIDTQDAPSDPLIPKEVVLDILEKRGFKNAKIKKPCVTADYKLQSLHIDITIYTKDNTTNDYKLAVGKKNSSSENRIWSESDPVGLIDWVNNKEVFILYQDEKIAQYRRLVRYIKRWRNIKFSEEVGRKVFSIGLTIMLKEHFKPSINTEGVANDLIALKNTIDSITYQSTYFNEEKTAEWRVHVNLPVKPYRDIFTGSSLNTGTQLRNKFSSLNNSLQEVINEKDENEQCEKLRQIFGEDFPKGTVKKDANNIQRVAYATAGAVGTSQGA